MAEPQAFRFLDLSAELRNQIYELLLKDWYSCIHLLKSPRSGNLFISEYHGSSCVYVTILRVNRQIHSEATPILYRNKITCADDPAGSVFLKQIGGSITLLRQLRLAWCSKSSIRHTLVLLKQATHLDRIEMCYEATECFGDVARMVKEIGPWFRAFHKMRRANLTDNHDSALDILSFVPIFHGWESDKFRGEQSAKAASYSAEVKAALLKTLKG